MPSLNVFGQCLRPEKRQNDLASLEIDLRADDLEEEQAAAQEEQAAAQELPGESPAQCPFTSQKVVGPPVPLVVSDGKFRASKPSADLLASIGGRDRLFALTSRFYPKMFRDKQLSLFVRDFDDPHPARLADWIAEKMSGEAYWSSQLRSRPADQPRDRQDAHHHAWNSPKRHPSQFGERFRLDDAIMWMRLMFWSCREEGLDSGPFFDWFQKFIGHFIRVYTSKAPPYVAACVSWSSDPSNIGKYEADGWLMKDVVGMGR